MRKTLHRRAWRPLGKGLPLLVVGALALSACQKKQQSQEVVAAGKSFEVTIPEFDQLLRQAPAVRKEEVDPTRKRLLDALIDQKLFAEAAVEQKLDRNIDTMQQLEAERRRVLASAYLDKLANSAAKPTSREEQVYYDARPRSFAQRKVYTIDQVAVAGDNLPIAEYRAALEAAGLKGLDARLAQDGINVVATNVVIPSEALPPAAAEQMEKLAVGAPVVFNTGGAFHMGVVTAIQDGSVSIDQARTLIDQRILDERREAVIKAQAERLRSERQVQVQSTLNKGAKPQ